MKTYAQEAAPPPLSALVEEVKRGEEIVLTDHNQPVGRMVPPIPSGVNTCSQAPPLRAGCLKGFWMSPDFGEPLEDFKDYME